MAGTASPRFSDATLAFLRALRRNNKSEWFRARKADYEAHVRDPMVAIIDRLALDFSQFAPELIASQKVSLFRPYRDTRFSQDKRPLKTHVSAVFPCRGLARHQGAGLYLEVNCDRVLLGGGLHTPQTPELQRARAYLAANHARWRALVESSSFRRSFGKIQGESLVRVPRGFAADHPAADYLKLRSLVALREYPAAFATSARFYPTIVRLFEQLAPMIRFLNQPLLAAAPPPDPLRFSPRVAGV